LACRGVRDPQFLLHGRGEVGQHGLVEIGQRPCRSVEDCQVAACGRNLVDSGLGLVDDRGQQLVVTLLEILLCDLFEIVAALDEIIQFLLFELAHGVRHGREILVELLILVVIFDDNVLHALLKILTVSFDVGLHLLHFRHHRDNFLGVDAPEFLCEERCGAHHEYNRKG